VIIAISKLLSQPVSAWRQHVHGLSLLICSYKRHQGQQPRNLRLFDADGHPHAEVVLCNRLERAGHQLAGRLIEHLVRRHEVAQLHRNAAGSGFHDPQRRLMQKLEGVDRPTAEKMDFCWYCRFLIFLWHSILFVLGCYFHYFSCHYT
jgi:hypothetical protein